MCQQQHQKEREGGREKRSGEQGRVTDSVKYKYGLCLHYSDRCRNQKPKCYKHNDLASRTSTYQREENTQERNAGRRVGEISSDFGLMLSAEGSFQGGDDTCLSPSTGVQCKPGHLGPSHKQVGGGSIAELGEGH